MSFAQQLGRLISKKKAKTRRTRRARRRLAVQPLEPRIVLATGVFIDSGQLLAQSGGSAETDVQFSDLDGDGDLDAVTANPSAAGAVYFNDGTGILSLQQSIGGGFFVALGDIDGDGDNDAFISGSGANVVWLNDGSGTLVDSGQSLGAASSRNVALSDFDGDGDLDALVGNTNAAPQVWLNSGDGLGTLVAGPTLGTSPIGGRIAVADLDNDGDQDAYVGKEDRIDGAEFASTVWLNDGTANFSSTGQQIFDGIQTLRIGLGDLDGDLDVDAFVVNGVFDTPEPDQIWLNDGTGTFADSGQRIGAVATRNVALGDLDGDGDLDAFVGNGGGRAFPAPHAVWLNDGAGIFSDSGQRIGNGTSVVALGDLDGDQDLDVYLADRYFADTVWFNGADPSISGRVFADLDQNGLDFHDFNGDATEDDNEPAEPSLAGWTIELRDDVGTLIGTTASNDQGDYRFDDLAFDTAYTVNQIVPSGWQQIAPSTSAHTVTMPLGHVASGVDFGNFGNHSSDVFNSSDVPKMIKGSTTHTSSLTVSSSHEIFDVSVELNLEVNRVDGLDVTLISPNGTTVLLHSVVESGPGGRDLNGTRFDDEADLDISLGEGDFRDVYRPVDPAGLRQLIGEDAQGTWTLQVADYTFNGKRGHLNSWSIRMVSLSTPPIPNDPPVINSAPVTMATQDAAYTYDVDATDPDVGDTLTYSFDVSPGGMTIDSSTGEIAWTPTNGQVGLNAVTVRVEDQLGASDTQSFTIDVANVNDAPVAADDTYTTDQDTTLNVAVAGVLSNDSDADGDPITVASHTNPANGTVTVNSDGSFGYTPNPGFTGVDSFTYQSSDGTLLSDVATVTVTVSAPSSTIHVSDLDAVATPVSRGKWNVTVTITVFDASGNPVAGATVTGEWSSGASGTATCTTGANGQCSVTKNNIKKNSQSVTFTVTNLVHASFAYDPDDNDDPDTDSDGTTIVILKP